MIAPQSSRTLSLETVKRSVQMATGDIQEIIHAYCNALLENTGLKTLTKGLAILQAPYQAQPLIFLEILSLACMFKFAQRLPNFTLEIETYTSVLKSVEVTRPQNTSEILPVANVNQYARIQLFILPTASRIDASFVAARGPTDLIIQMHPFAERYAQKALLIIRQISVLMSVRPGTILLASTIQLRPKEFACTLALITTTQNPLTVLAVSLATLLILRIIALMSVSGTA